MIFYFIMNNKSFLTVCSVEANETATNDISNLLHRVTFRSFIKFSIVIFSRFTSCFNCLFILHPLSDVRFPPEADDTLNKLWSSNMEHI